MLGSVIWILDASWGWSAVRVPQHALGLPRLDRAASSCTASPGAFTLGVLLNLGPRIGKYTKDGLARTFKPHNLHLTLMGLMLIFTGFYALLRGLPRDPVDDASRLGQHLPQPDDALAITFAITIGFAGGFTGGWFASRGDPFWTLSGGLAGVISVSAGADVYAPSLVVPDRDLRRRARRLCRRLHREEAAHRRRGRGGGRARRLRLLEPARRRPLRGGVSDGV